MSQEQIHNRRRNAELVGQSIAAQALTESIGLDSELSYLKEVLAKHDLSELARTDLQQQVEAIQQRLEDPNLYLAFVGEFCSGKSTLINALIRDDLLKTDVLQATTSAATVIRHGDPLTIAVTYGGEIQCFPDQQILSEASIPFSLAELSDRKQKVKDLLHKFTADEAVAQQVSKVEIRHPSDTLKRGLVIIDTPGANATNTRHVEVAGWAIRELCDTAAILIPSDIPVSRSLLDFISCHLQDVVHRCVFIVTKIDGISFKEQDHFLKSIQARLAGELSLEQVTVLPVAAGLIAESLSESSSSDDDNHFIAEHRETLLAQFHRSEEYLWNILHRDKLVILTERLSLLLLRVYSRLGEELEEREIFFTDCQEAFEKNRVPDFIEFVDNQKQARLKEIESRARAFQDEAVEAIDQIHDKTSRVLRHLIGSAESETWLLKVLSKENLKTTLQEIELRMQDDLSRIFENFEQVQISQMRRFSKDFAKIYSSLATLGGKVKTESEKTVYVPLNLAGTFSRFDDQFSKLGDKIGTSLGLTLDSMFTQRPSLKQVKEQYQSLFDSILHQVFSDVIEGVRRNLDRNMQAAQKAMKAFIEEHFRQYDQLVSEIIDNQNRESAKLQRVRVSVQTDRVQLSERHDRLVRIREKLRKMQSN